MTLSHFYCVCYTDGNEGLDRAAYQHIYELFYDIDADFESDDVTGYVECEVCPFCTAGTLKTPVASFEELGDHDKGSLTN